MKSLDWRWLIPRIAAAVLIAATLGSTLGWIYTVRKLNEQTAYRPVALEALQARQSERNAARADDAVHGDAFGPTPSLTRSLSASASASALEARLPTRTR